MGTVSKFITAVVGGVGAFLAVVLTPEDNATAQAVIVAVVSLLTALGVYAVPNAPSAPKRDYR